VLRVGEDVCTGVRRVVSDTVTVGVTVGWLAGIHTHVRDGVTLVWSLAQPKEGVMRQEDHDFLETECCEKIASRAFLDYHHCRNMFTILRNYAKPRSGDLIRDLGNSMAHYERDRGSISKYLREFHDRWLAQRDSGGEIDVPVVYPISDLYAELFFVLRELDIGHDEQRMRENQYQFVSRIGWGLDGLVVRLDKDDKSNFCTFVGDVHVSPMITQPGCVFNALTVDIDGDPQQPALPGMARHHSHFAIPLLFDYVSTVELGQDD